MVYEADYSYYLLPFSLFITIKRMLYPEHTHLYNVHVSQIGHLNKGQIDIN